MNGAQREKIGTEDMVAVENTRGAISEISKLLKNAGLYVDLEGREVDVKGGRSICGHAAVLPMAPRHSLF